MKKKLHQPTLILQQQLDKQVNIEIRLLHGQIQDNLYRYELTKLALTVLELRVAIGEEDNASLTSTLY